MSDNQNQQMNYLQNKIAQHFSTFKNTNTTDYFSFYNSDAEKYSQIKNLKEYFASYHYQINRLFDFLNYKASTNGHYNSQESNELLVLIKELEANERNLVGSTLNFEINNYYKQVIKMCQTFLKPSYGSPIPESFKPIVLIEAKPIFSFRNIRSRTVSISRDQTFHLSSIGSGSYATVHKYKDMHYNKNFVIKKAKKELTEKELIQFKREFDEMKKLNSPYVIEVYNFDQEKNEYTMEYADYTLLDFIEKENTKLSGLDRVRIINQIFRALNYIHSKDILHRDLSPTNILIKKYDEINIVKIADFGLVKIENSDLTNWNTQIKGTFNDPHLNEVGFHNYNLCHEIYALTRVIYFVMTGRRNIDKFKTEYFEEFVRMGISSNHQERYKNVLEMEQAFKSVLSTYS